MYAADATAKIFPEIARLSAVMSPKNGAWSRAGTIALWPFPEDHYVGPVTT